MGSRRIRSQTYELIFKPKAILPEVFEWGITMRQIVDGLLYDSENAEVIGECGAFESDRSNFRWWDGTLHRTEKGRFFLAGQGGPMSRFADIEGRTRRSGSGIQPLTDAEALDLASLHLDSDVVEKHFAHMIEPA